MKRKKVKYLYWWDIGWGAWLVSYGIGKLSVMGAHWLNGLWIVVGAIFIIVGVYRWKVAKNVN